VLEVEITGWDSVVFTFTPPRQVFAHVLATVLTRWPTALMEGLDGDPSALEPVAEVPAERLPNGEGHLIFYRNAAMARHMDQAAYEPMADGDGPFAVITRLRRCVEFEATGLDELISLGGRRSEAATKAAATHKRRAAGVKAARTKKRRAAGRKAAATRKAKRAEPGASTDSET
jgi:hypothetical protein